MSRPNREKNLSRAIRRLTWVALAAFAVLAAMRVLADADRLPYFVDEMVYHEAAYRFFTSGDYTSSLLEGGMRPFHPKVSTGILASGLPGAIWASGGGSLLAIRLAVGAWVLAQLLILIALSGAALGLPALEAAVSAGVLVAAILHAPYGAGFLMSLGELPGAIGLAAGVLLLQRRPGAAFLIWGLSAWLIKSFYVPAGLLFFFAVVLTRRRGRLRLAAEGLGAFFAPLVAWVVLVALRYDSGVAGEWLRRTFSFLAGSAQGGWVPKTEAVLAVPFWERFTSPQLEWVTFTLSDKLKIAAVLIPALAVSGHQGLRVLRARKLEAESALVSAAGAFVALHWAWWFFYHPTMIMRHLQPALYVGMGILFYMWARRRPKWSTPRSLAVVLALVLGLVAYEGAGLTRKWPLISSEPSYARLCRGDLLTEACFQSAYPTMIGASRSRSVK